MRNVYDPGDELVMLDERNDDYDVKSNSSVKTNNNVVLLWDIIKVSYNYFIAKHTKYRKSLKNQRKRKCKELLVKT